jgi:hypothetical protein
MSVSSPIGFDGRSFREMEKLWSGIELFWFEEATDFSMVSEAVLNYAGGAKAQEEIIRLLRTHFYGRIGGESEGILNIDTLEANVKSVSLLVLRPLVLKNWDEPDFNLVREIDRVLRNGGIVIKHEPKGRVFYRGAILS